MATNLSLDPKLCTTGTLSATLARIYVRKSRTITSCMPRMSGVCS
jgi:hypothetical protein